MRCKGLRRARGKNVWLKGIARGYDEGMESTNVMVPANGMMHKLKEELRNDGTLLFGLIFLAHLDNGSQYFWLLFSFIASFIHCLYFPSSLSVCISSFFSCFVSAILTNNKTTSNFVNL